MYQIFRTLKPIQEKGWRLRAVVCLVFSLDMAISGYHCLICNDNTVLSIKLHRVMTAAYLGYLLLFLAFFGVPNLLTTWHTIQGHPCMGVLRLMTLNFGGGAGGKSSTRGIFTASSGVSIRQCWRMLLRFVVHNLRISPFTNINALTECLVPQLVYCLCQLVNYIWFPLVKRLL